ncbi:MAG: UDP-2,3-diacylglucosamine diphosphatase LpxI [Vampirovibrionales bacterium]|nr:UDP-2,3-diacylglucosamine diphosphatase LpxI [Vampirovibrionales bacterium]
MPTETPLHDAQPQSIAAKKRLGMIAGEGDLPVQAAKNAADEAIEVIGFALTKGNQQALAKHCARVYPISPGLLGQTLALIQQEGITELIFAGKVNKWILFRNPQLDKMAISALQQLQAQKPLNDDEIMQTLCNMLFGAGIIVKPQTQYLQHLLLGPQQLSQAQPTASDWRDIAYGFKLAKTLGQIDVGQTVVIKDGMALALEAIEGTDACIKRAGQWGRRSLWWFRRRHPGGSVVKVAKPQQDNRFDVPTVGLRTLKAAHAAGFKVLAVEAGATLFLEPEKMTDYANAHQMVLIAVGPDDLAKHTHATI